MIDGPTARADLRGHRIDVRWSWSGEGTRPGFRLLRRRRAYPARADDGLVVVDMEDLFAGEDAPWARVSCTRYLLENSVAEGGLVQGEVTLFHSEADSSEPSRVRIRRFDPEEGSVKARTIDEVSRVERKLPDPAPWGAAEDLEIFHTPGGGTEESAGVVRVLWDHPDGETFPVFRWLPAGGVEEEVGFHTGRVLQSTADVESLEPGRISVRWTRLRRSDGWDLATLLSHAEDADPEDLVEEDLFHLDERFSADTGEWTRSMWAADLGPVPEETSYYALFRPDSEHPDGWRTEREWRARATATARYGFPDRLYRRLPALHQYHDEPTEAERGKGQLRRYVQVFGSALDHLRSSVEGLANRHDLHRVRGDELPALAAWLGWTLDRSSPLPWQRNEIRFAPEVYQTVGTLPNLTALVSRATGWSCEAKEFVHNIFRTNAPEYVPVRELREIRNDGDGFGEHRRWTATEKFDGRPAAAVDGEGRTWLFWHTNRSGRWEIWFEREGGSDSLAPGPVEEVPEDRPAPTYSDLSPRALVVAGSDGDQVWVVWESNREGAWDVWARIHDGAGWGEPFRITDHRASDRCPAVAAGPSGEVWIFWESERRGRTEIWSRVMTDPAWGPPTRMTDSPVRDGEPAAATDADGKLWLVWRRDEGDGSSLYRRVLRDDGWGDAEALEEGFGRDGSPALVRWEEDLWLLWHTNRTGRWELWGRIHDGDSWGSPFQITQGPDSDKEPFALLDGSELRVFWRLDRPALQHRSRTVDTRDSGLLEGMGRLRDRVHYTYDTARGEDDWYARDTVGLYLTPPSDFHRDPAKVVERARSYVEPFRPASVRLVWVVADEDDGVEDAFDDGVAVDDPIVDEFEDEIDGDG